MYVLWNVKTCRGRISPIWLAGYSPFFPVVIFGVSFGDIDYSYFDRFFKSIVNDESIKEEDKKYITIFTKDDNSRMAIIRQLRKMEIDMQRLYAQSHFQIICTEEEYYKDILDDFYKRLDKYSEKNRPRISVL